VPAVASAPATTSEPIRDHRLFAPGVAGPTPLLVVLHGYGTSADRVARGLRLAEVAVRHRVTIVAPNATADRSGRQAWNATDACCDFDGRGVDDVAALRQLIAHMRATRAIDPQRIYLAGFSNGSFMTQRLACELDDVAAIASLSGAGLLDPKQCRRRRPLAMLHVHGDADTIVRYQGGQVLSKKHLPAHPGADATAEAWGARNGCSGFDRAQDRFAGLPNHRRIYRGCAQPVERWRVEGGGHVIGTDRESVDRIVSFLLAQRSAPQ
jgi:polyhydroxybutyrate depolymerase